MLGLDQRIFEDALDLNSLADLCISPFGAQGSSKVAVQRKFIWDLVSAMPTEVSLPNRLPVHGLCRYKSPPTAYQG